MQQSKERPNLKRTISEALSKLTPNSISNPILPIRMEDPQNTGNKATQDHLLMAFTSPHGLCHHDTAGGRDDDKKSSDVK